MQRKFPLKPLLGDGALPREELPESCSESADSRKSNPPDLRTWRPSNNPGSYRKPVSEVQAPLLDADTTLSLVLLDSCRAKRVSAIGGARRLQDPNGTVGRASETRQETDGSSRFPPADC